MFLFAKYHNSERSYYDWGLCIYRLFLFEKYYNSGRSYYD